MIAARQIDYFTLEDKALLHAILYFDIFNYPITAEEAIAFAPLSVNAFSNVEALEKLVSEKLIFRFGNFYSAQNNPQLADRRIGGNELAVKKMKAARRFSQIVSSFPFVRAVLLSGSISKGYMDEKSDIDYFIITEAKRLWIVRTALAVFRRVFLFNSHTNLCTNYFIDMENLSIPDQNIFTATELCTLIPMYGQDVVQRFNQANSWALKILPHAKFNNAECLDKHEVIKNRIENIFSFSSMNILNQWLMKKSMYFWKRKYAHALSSSDFEIAFRTKEGVSKSHPRFFQRRALEQFKIKIQDFETRHGLDLTL
jgi:hypothetical protein